MGEERPYLGDPSDGCHYRVFFRGWFDVEGTGSRCWHSCRAYGERSAGVRENAPEAQLARSCGDRALVSFVAYPTEMEGCVAGMIGLVWTNGLGLKRMLVLMSGPLGIADVHKTACHEKHGDEKQDLEKGGQGAHFWEICLHRANAMPEEGVSVHDPSRMLDAAVPEIPHGSPAPPRNGRVICRNGAPVCLPAGGRRSRGHPMPGARTPALMGSWCSVAIFVLPPYSRKEGWCIQCLNHPQEPGSSKLALNVIVFRSPSIHYRRVKTLTSNCYEIGSQNPEVTKSIKLFHCCDNRGHAGDLPIGEALVHGGHHVGLDLCHDARVHTM